MRLLSLLVAAAAAVPCPAWAIGCSEVEAMVARGAARADVVDAIGKDGGMTPDLARCLEGIDAVHGAQVARREGRIEVIAGTVGFGVGVGVLAIGRTGPVRRSEANARSMTGGIVLVASAAGVLVGSSRIADAKAFDEVAEARKVSIVVAPGGIGLAGTF